MLLCLWVITACWSLTQGLLAPPQITYFPKDDLDDPDDVINVESGFTLTCNASGSLPMTFTWLRNGKTMSSFFPDIISVQTPKKGIKNSHSSSLQVRYPKPNADGKYQCIVQNAAGGTFTRKLRVKTTFTNDFDKHDNDPTEVVDVVVGKPLRLVCPSHSKSASHEDFGAAHVWARKKEGSISNLSPNSNRAKMPNGNFLFLFLSTADVKQIQGFAQNSVQCSVTAGNTIYWSHLFTFKVTSTETQDILPKFLSSDDYPKSHEKAVQGKVKALYCAAVGKPAPQITWLRLAKDKKTILKKIENGKDGFLIPPSDFGRKLYIPVVSKEQHEPGYYQCVAKNSVGEVKSNPSELEVFVAPKWSSKPPAMKAVPILGNTELLCEAVGTPLPQYKWYHNGTEFKSDNELGPHIIVDGNILKFNNIARKHEGIFQCAAENNWGMLVSGTWLRVEAHKPDIKNFGPFYIFKGTTATLRCDSNAAPAANHEWSKDGKLLNIKGRLSLDSVQSLVIRGVTSDDEGEYTCKAINDLGTDTESARATVYERTKIIRPQVPLSSIFITLKKPLDLQCEATADSRLMNYLKYKWLKDGATLKYDDRIKWLSGMKILKIAKANVHDGAKYTCVAFTDAVQRSQDTASTIADVKGVPFPPSDLKITSCGNRTTVISWKKGKDNDSPTTNFIVEQESTYYPDVWETIANITDTTKTSYKIDLTAWANLTFRMRAINKIGPSRASTPTDKGDCVTGMFSPKMHPKNLRGIPGKANELDIAWTPMTKLEADGPNLRYRLYYRKYGQTTFKLVIIRDPTKDRFTVPKPGYYVKWEFQIVAENYIDKGPSSDIKWSFSGQDAPKGKPENVKMGDVTARTIALSWNRVNVDGPGSIDGYNIYYWIQSKSTSARRRREIPVGAKVFKAAHTTEDIQKAVVTGLTPYSSYSLALKAYNSGGQGPQSNQISFETKQDVPGKVKDFKAYPFSSYIFASWGEPPEKNGVLLGYTIAAIKHNDKEPQQPAPTSGVIDIPTIKFEYLFDKMEPESRYVIYLRAKTKIGPGPVLIADIRTIAPAKPSKPRAPIANSYSTTAVNVTFLFGETVGGYPLEFMIKYRETANNQSYEKTGWFDHLDKRWAIVDGLAKDRLHEFVTVGRNKLGISPDSPPTQARPVPAVGAGKRASIPFYKTPWFIILLVLIVLLLLLLLVAILYTRRRGAKYPVGKREKERAGILDQSPDEDDVDMGRMDDNPPPYPSQGSLEKPTMSDDDRDSLDDYGDGPQFKEDGSFIEEYGDDRKKLSDDKDKSATATFV